MKTKVLLLLLALSTSTCLLAQDGNKHPDGQRPPPRNGDTDNQNGEARPGQMEPTTNAQMEQVKAILSKYDANALTPNRRHSSSPWPTNRRNC